MNNLERSVATTTDCDVDEECGPLPVSKLEVCCKYL